jgi:hypothetical protein
MFRLLIVLAAVCATVGAQDQRAEFSVGYILPPENNFTPLASGGTLQYPSISVNRSVVATVVIANRGTARGAVNAINISGAAFILTGVPALPVVLDPGRELRVGVVFAPRQIGRSAGSLSLALTEGGFRAELAGTTAQPELVLAYLIPSEGNVIQVSSGATLAFPPTRVNTPVSAVVSAGNRGVGGGYIQEISLTGDRFRLTGLAPLPLFLEANTELRIGVTFDAKEIEVATGVLRIVVDDKTLVLNLEGRATGPRFSYQIGNNGSAAELRPAAIFGLPDTALGDTLNLTVQVKNTGNAEGQIAGISLVGDGFQLSNVPFFPHTMLPDSALAFQVVFTPRQPGAATGRLRIGQDAFDLQGQVTGSQLLYSYRSGGAAVPLRDARNVLWAPVELGQSSQVEMLVKNAGNSAATIASVLVVDSRSAFKLTTPPALPAVIEPGAELALPILFTPLTAGDHSARLFVDGDTFNLVAVAAPLPPLPRIDLRGPGRLQGPLEQRPVSITLAEPYPLPLTGVLTLGVNSGNFTVDPAVQFSTGGRSAAFQIPAGGTRASFQGLEEVYFQTGSVAANIVIQASFAARGINVTPDTAPAIEIAVAPAPPRVLDVQVEARSANSLAVIVTGLATTRSLTQLDLQFVSSPKYNVTVPRFSLDITPASSAWYRRRDSEAYGSLFTASIPFSLQTGETVNPEEIFQSISATLTNELGRSNTLSTPPRP